MKTSERKLQQPFSLDIRKVAASIAKTQRPDGEIPWCNGQKTDPWDHTESIMGLSVAGFYKEALLGFEWLLRNQLEDGSWYASYENSVPKDKTHDTNMSSYIAVGVFHYYLITKDKDFIKRMWPSVKKAIDFALTMQTQDGEVYWAKSPDGVVEKMFIEADVPGDPFDVSDADTMLSYLNPEAQPPKRITLLGKPGCSHCTRAKAALDARGLKFEEITVGSHGVSLATLHAVSGKGSTPQIFVEGAHIGGADELEIWLANN